MKLRFKNLADLCHYRKALRYMPNPYFLHTAERDNLGWRMFNHRFANNRVINPIISSLDRTVLPRKSFWKSPNL